MKILENKQNIIPVLKTFAGDFWMYGAAIVLIVFPWFLKSGYIFLTDMVWGPNMALDWRSSWFIFYFLIKIFSFVFPVAFLQKIVFSGTLLFILLGGRIFVKSLVACKEGGEISKSFVFVLSLFVLFNPFVYDRALYGQLGVLLAYGSLLYTGAYLIVSWKCLHWSRICSAAFFSALALMFSPHFIFFLLPLYALFFLAVYLKRREIIERNQGRKFLLAVLVSMFIVIVLNAHWLISNVFYLSSTIDFVNNGVTRQDFIAFQTAGKNSLQTFTNVLSLSGFWGKDQSRYVDLTDVSGWQMGLVLLTPIIFFGVWIGFRKRNRDERILNAGVLVFFIIAVLLAVGIKAPVAREFSFFLYDHLPFYRGLREPQKWVAVIIPIYLFYLTLGVNRIRMFKFINDNRSLCGIILAIVIIMQAPLLLFGFNGQIKPVEYPKDWYEINQYIAENDHCQSRVLFLPWHLYMSFYWMGRIIANPASVFFSCPVVQGTNMEWGDISMNYTEPESKMIEEWIMSKGSVDFLAGSVQDVRYIILAKELDWMNYRWLDDTPKLKFIKETRTLRLYEWQR